MAKKIKNVGILHEWEIIAKQLQKLLGADPEITAIIDNKTKSIDIITGNDIKANAIFDILRNEPLKWEDGASLSFKVNGEAKTYKTTCKLMDYVNAFQSNPYFSHIEKSKSDSYVMWKPVPVQVAVNNIQDPNGFEHIMPVNLAQTVFQPAFAQGTEPLNVYFCAD